MCINVLRNTVSNHTWGTVVYNLKVVFGTECRKKIWKIFLILRHLIITFMNLVSHLLEVLKYIWNLYFADTVSNTHVEQWSTISRLSLVQNVGEKNMKDIYDLTSLDNHFYELVLVQQILEFGTCSDIVPRLIIATLSYSNKCPPLINHRRRKV